MRNIPSTREIRNALCLIAVLTTAFACSKSQTVLSSVDGGTDTAPLPDARAADARGPDDSGADALLGDVPTDASTCSEGVRTLDDVPIFIEGWMRDAVPALAWTEDYLAVGFEEGTEVDPQVAVEFFDPAGRSIRRWSGGPSGLGDRVPGITTYVKFLGLHRGPTSGALTALVSALSTRGEDTYVGVIEFDGAGEPDPFGFRVPAEHITWATRGQDGRFIVGVSDSRPPGEIFPTSYYLNPRILEFDSEGALLSDRRVNDVASDEAVGHLRVGVDDSDRTFASFISTSGIAAALLADRGSRAEYVGAIPCQPLSYDFEILSGDVQVSTVRCADAPERSYLVISDPRTTASFSTEIGVLAAIPALDTFGGRVGVVSATSAGTVQAQFFDLEGARLGTATLSGRTDRVSHVAMAARDQAFWATAKFNDDAQDLFVERFELCSE